MTKTCHCGILFDTEVDRDWCTIAHRFTGHCEYKHCGKPIYGKKKRFCDRFCRAKEYRRINYASPYVHTEDVPRDQETIDEIMDAFNGDRFDRTVKGHSGGHIGIRAAKHKVIG